MKAIQWALVTVACMFLIPSSAQMKSEDNIVIHEPVNKDLYVAGGTVTINAPVRGDLILAAGTVSINDTITQDILLAGGNINFNGYVGDDIRCAGGSITIESEVAGDVVVAGGTVTIKKGAVIHGNLIATGGELSVDGKVKGMVKSAAGKFTLNGNIDGDMDCRGGEITINGSVDGNSVLAASAIEIGSDAIFDGDVKYWNKKGTPDFKNVVNNGKATYDPSLEIKSGKLIYLGFASVLIALWYLGSALLMIFLIQYLFDTTMKNAASTVKKESMKSLGYGLVFLIGVPIAIIITAITIVGVPVSILLAIGYIILLLLATVIVSLITAHWINSTYYHYSWSSVRIALTAFGLFIFIKLASLTPVVGPLILMLVICMAFGAILLNIKWKRNKGLNLT